MTLKRPCREAFYRLSHKFSKSQILKDALFSGNPSTFVKHLNYAALCNITREKHKSLNGRLLISGCLTLGLIP
jgi:hypothetical protein